jgi:hypothetical protein
MKPTSDDLARLIPDARRGYEREPLDTDLGVPRARAAIEALHTVILLLAAPTVAWADVWALALRALHLCALIAWEAGRRMGRADPPTAAETPAAKSGARSAILDYLRRFVGTGGGVPWSRILGAVGLPGEATRGAMRELVAEGLVSASDDAVTLYTPTYKAWAEVPAAKGVDVEALLAEVRSWGAGECSRGGRTIWHVAEDLAVALRAEQKSNASMFRFASEACGHLRAVLDFMWPSYAGGPTVVQKARAFLAGEEHAPRHEGSPSYPGTPQGLVDELRDVRRERDMYQDEFRKKGAALERMVERYERERASFNQVAKELWIEREASTKLRAELATEDEAQTHLRAAANDALAAQNRAESEAAALRAQLAAMTFPTPAERLDAMRQERDQARAERDAVRAELQRLVAGVERLMAGMPKGKA